MPLTGLGVVVILSTVVAAFLLLVPALFVSVWWSVANVVLVAEGRGVLGSLHRSKDLTEGNRWRIFGLLAACVIGSWGLEWALTSATTALWNGWPLEVWTATIVGVRAACYIVTDVVFAVIIASLYHDLRQVKEGDSSHQLAAVFD